jgi:hypothetical protein
MNKNEFAAIAAALQTYYPRFNLLPNRESMALWFQELSDIPAETLTAALRKWVSTEKWPPTIADLRGLCTNMVQGELPDWGEAWAEVTQAVRRYGWARPDDALASMSPQTRTAASRIGWLSICESENPEALRAQFRQIYESATTRETESRQLPAAVRNVIAMIGKKEMPALEAKNE